MKLLVTGQFKSAEGYEIRKKSYTMNAVKGGYMNAVASFFDDMKKLVPPDAICVGIQVVFGQWLNREEELGYKPKG